MKRRLSQKIVISDKFDNKISSFFSFRGNPPEMITAIKSTGITEIHIIAYVNILRIPCNNTDTRDRGPDFFQGGKIK